MSKLTSNLRKSCKSRKGRESCGTCLVCNAANTIEYLRQIIKEKENIL
jgi:hypothetical protein